MKKSNATAVVVGAKRSAASGMFREVALPRGGSAVVMDHKVFKAASSKANDRIREIVAGHKAR